MSTSTYDAREALAPGGAYCRAAPRRPHDSLAYIGPERAQAALHAAPVPVAMFMNMTNVPPRFCQQQRRRRPAPPSSSSRLLSQEPLSQAGAPPLSLSQGLSQPELSQESVMMEYQSQADGLLSQDSTYQGAYHPQARFSQPY